MCLAGTVVASWSLTQEVAGSSLFTVMTNIFVTEFSKFNETFKKNSIVHLPLAHHPYYPLQFPHFVYLSYYINAHQLTPTLPISHIVFKMHHLKCSAISFMSANELEDGISFGKARQKIRQALQKRTDKDWCWDGKKATPWERFPLATSTAVFTVIYCQ